MGIERICVGTIHIKALCKKKKERKKKKTYKLEFTLINLLSNPLPQGSKCQIKVYRQRPDICCSRIG